MRVLIGCINGLLRHSQRVLQLRKVCEQLNIVPKNAAAIGKESAWFSGFFDANGGFHLNFKNLSYLEDRNPVLGISVVTKDFGCAACFRDTFGGDVSFATKKRSYYRWRIYDIDDAMRVMRFVQYFDDNPSYTTKEEVLFLIGHAYFQLYSVFAYDKESVCH